MAYIKIVLKFIASLFFIITTYPLKIFLKKNTVIIQTFNPEVYCENTKYLYEYLSFNTNMKVYWVAENPKVISYLKKKKLKFISKRKNFFNFILITLKAKVVIDSGSQFFNPFNLIDKKVFKITTWHGSGPKDVPLARKSLKEPLFEINNLNSFDYVNFPSRWSLNRSGKNSYQIPETNLVNLGYPKCDQLFNRDYVEMKYKKKEIAQSLLNKNFDGSEKIILYTPAWRPYQFDFPLSLMENMSYEKFNNYLLKNNYYFFYSINPIVLFTSNILKKYERIILIDREEHPFYDSNSFMPEVDILINDYSTTTTDFSLLKRPQIFYLPDFEAYESAKGFIDDYKQIMPGKEVKNYDQMISTINQYIDNKENYLNEYSERINQYLNRYYDLENTNSCQLFSKFIQDLIEK